MYKNSYSPGSHSASLSPASSGTALTLSRSNLYRLCIRNHAEMLDNVIAVENCCKEDTLKVLGGFEVVAPVFYLLRFYEPKHCYSILNDLLSLV